MRTALCLFGLIGNAEGKSGNIKEGQLDVLKYSHKHWKKYILKKNNVDIFIHSWNTDIQNEVNRLFAPVNSVYEEPINFDIPDYVLGEEKRKQNHYSRWYSTAKSLELKHNHEKKHRFQYDCVMSARFDIGWRKPIIFKNHDMNNFYAPGWHRSSKTKLKDFWFFSNSATMDKFGELYYQLNEYNKPGASPINKQLGISNHRLSKYHLNALGIKVNFELECANDYDPLQSDYPLIRFLYYGAKI